MKPLACCTNSDPKPECAQALQQQPDSPVTQAGSITSTMQPYCSSTTADLAEGSVCQHGGTVCPAADLRAKSAQQQTASKHVRAPLRHNEGCQRKQISNNADVSASCPLQNLVHHQREAVTAGTTVKGRPRSSSWQRRRGAKLGQAQQDNPEGKLSCSIHTTCVHNLQQAVTNDHMAVSLPNKVLCMANDVQCWFATAQASTRAHLQRKKLQGSGSSGVSTSLPCCPQ